MIDGKEHNLNAGNLTYSADKFISENAADKLIATAINAGDSSDFLTMLQVDLSLLSMMSIQRIL